MLKRSAYTLLFPSFDESGIVYNSASGRLCLLNPHTYSLARQVLWRPNFPYKNADCLRVRSDLVEKGFLVERQRDELGQLEAASRRVQQDHSEFGLTLAPTNDCNLNCVYCYEGRHEPLTWTGRDEEAVLSFVSTRLPVAAALSVTWYGGEPLLALPVVIRMSERLRELAKSRRGTWTCDMVTNGTLLTPEVVEALVAVRCSDLQITLDGPRPTNDRLRPSRDGSSCFDTIIGNIVRIDTGRIGIGIRINLMKDNVAGVADLVHELSALGLAGRINVSLAPVEEVARSCHALANRVMSAGEFADRHFDFLLCLDREGFAPQCVPQPISSYCGAARKNAFVIDWRGDIFKCWNDVGLLKRRIGSVHSPAAMDPGATCRANLDPFQDRECRRCTLLPVCMGGCPAFATSPDRADRGCLFFKHRLADYLNLQVLRQLRQGLVPLASS